MKEEVSYYAADELEDELLDEERAAMLQIVKLSFVDKYKWTFADGSGGSLNADMEDEEFFKRIQSRQVTFASGDVLKVRLHSKTWRTEKGLRTEHRVLEVLDVIPAPRQIPLSLNGQGDQPTSATKSDPV